MIQNIKEEINHIIEKKIKEYGKFSNAVLVTKLSIVQNLIKHNDDSELINLLIQEIKAHYNESLPIHLKNRNSYQGELYGTTIPHDDLSISNSVRQLIKTVNTLEQLSEMEDLKWYLYIIDEFNNFKILNFPVSTAEIVMQRNYIDELKIPIIHYLLLFDKKDKVKAAGEICCLKNQSEPDSIIINNRSGHFQPHNDTLLFVRKNLENIGIMSEKIYIIDMGESNE